VRAPRGGRRRGSRRALPCAPLCALICALLCALPCPRPAGGEVGRAEAGGEARRARGFQDERDAATPGALSSVLWALGPGVAAHGAGHWSMGDAESARALLWVELLGAAALLSASLVHLHAPPATAAGQMSVEALKHVGWGLFVGSWAADVVGAYQGGLSFSLDRLVGRQRTFAVGYRYLDDVSYQLRHYLTARLALAESWGYARLGVDAEYAGRAAGVTADVGVHLLRPPRLTADGLPAGGGAGLALAVGVAARRWAWSDTRTLQLALTPYAEWSMPLARLAGGLRHTSVYQRVGAGWEGYAAGRGGAALPQLASAPRPAAAEHPRATLLLETGVRLNVFSETALRVSYLQDPTRDQAPARWGERVWGLSALGLVSEGFWCVEAQVRQSAALDLVAEAMVGERWSLWLSARYALTPSKRR